MTTLCTTFRKEAGFIWNRMHMAAGLCLSLSEETLTESALYNIALAHQDKDIVVRLATKPAEKKHGADWEWWLVHGTKVLGFRVQAKRLFPDGRYQSLVKPGGNPYQQLDRLVCAATLADMEPLYCFFNFDHPQAPLDAPNPCKHGYHRPSFWGCSLALPEMVKIQNSNRLMDLSPIMHPWHVLVCETSSGNLLNTARDFIIRASGRGDVREPPHIPTRVSRLIELGDRLRDPEFRQYLDDVFWDGEGDTPEDVSGLIVIRDLR
jgi:hypothetical protein